MGECNIPDNGKMVNLNKYEDDICVQCGRLLTINDLFLCQKCSKVYEVKLIIIPKGGDI